MNSPTRNAAGLVGCSPTGQRRPQTLKLDCNKERSSSHDTLRKWKDNNHSTFDAPPKLIAIGNPFGATLGFFARGGKAAQSRLLPPSQLGIGPRGACRPAGYESGKFLG